MLEWYMYMFGYKFSHFRIQPEKKPSSIPIFFQIPDADLNRKVQVGRMQHWYSVISVRDGLTRCVCVWREKKWWIKAALCVKCCDWIRCFIHYVLHFKQFIIDRIAHALGSGSEVFGKLVWILHSGLSVLKD